MSGLNEVRSLMLASIGLEGKYMHQLTKVTAEFAKIPYVELKLQKGGDAF